LLAWNLSEYRGIELEVNHRAWFNAAANAEGRERMIIQCTKDLLKNMKLERSPGKIKIN
jgi:hypothetical protein